ncbi:MAG TPA: hypothetical protein VNG51_28960 [Ktedonobacteraceae bacterium]|nr:hypothetical protein [Ktedonobacteraceae bacterium]
MTEYKHIQVSRLLISLSLLFLITLLTGCSSGITNTAPSTTPTPTIVGPQKGPGSANLTATAQATPVATVCPTFSAAPANTSGWHVYTDSRFSFHVAIPSGWHTGSFTSSSADGSSSYYTVMVRPPGSTARFNEEEAMADPDHFEITVILSGPLENIDSSGSGWTAEATPITIDGMKAKIYDRTETQCAGSIGRIIQITFMQQNYMFYMTSIPAKAKNDIALFSGMAESFA